jgi:hypothetical protein
MTPNRFPRVRSFGTGQESRLVRRSPAYGLDVPEMDRRTMMLTGAIALLAAATRAPAAQGYPGSIPYGILG